MKKGIIIFATFVLGMPVWAQSVNSFTFVSTMHAPAMVFGEIETTGTTSTTFQGTAVNIGNANENANENAPVGTIHINGNPISVETLTMQNNSQFGNGSGVWIVGTLNTGDGARVQANTLIAASVQLPRNFTTNFDVTTLTVAADVNAADVSVSNELNATNKFRFISNNDTADSNANGFNAEYEKPCGISNTFCL